MRAQKASLATLIIRSATISFLALAAGCSPAEEPVVSAPSPVTTTPVKPAAPVKATPQKAPSQTSASLSRQFFEQADDKASSASAIAQSAQSKDDWSLVASLWQEGIDLLKRVPNSDPQSKQAKQILAQYQRQLSYAQQRVKGEPIRKVVPVASRSKINTKTASTSAVAKSTTQPSTISAELALAKHLKQKGAIFYGTFWCPYCSRQKQLFGQQALSQIKYIECAPQGQNPRPDLCIRAKVRSFPTWQIDGQMYRGLRSLDELADLSGYQGSRDFVNNISMQ